MMWKSYFVVWSVALVSRGRCQYAARQELASALGADHEHDAGSGWDIRLAVPGEPGRDYPTLASVPKTGFSCAGKEAGYYADVETRCQVFRVCTIGATYGFQSFLCPNGTLFNQAVFVCDWWMNVNCQGSQRYYTNNNEKFGNLRLGPTMMTDIKKMLTYPVNNPYLNSNLNNNQYVMQVYSPPAGQPFSNSAILQSQFPPAQQLQVPAFQNGNNRYNENQFAGSTPSPQYVPAQENNNLNAQGQNNQLINTGNVQCVSCQTSEAEIFSSVNNAQQLGQLRKEENGNSYTDFSKSQHQTGNNGHYTNGHIQNSKSSQLQNSQYHNSHPQVDSQKYQFSETLNSGDHLQGAKHNSNAHQLGRLVQVDNNFNGQYNDEQQKTENNRGRQSELEITFTKQQYTYPSQYDKQYTYKIPTNQDVNSQQVGQLQEVKQNLVSENPFKQSPTIRTNTNSVYSPPTVISKTLTINKEVKSGKLVSPTSRITFNSWVVQPTKSNQLNSKQGPYKYERPKLSRQYLALHTPRPTVSSRLYLTPTTRRPTVASRLYIVPSSSRPTTSSRLYLTPTTSRPSSMLYLAPPSSTRQSVSTRQYLTPPVSKPTQSAGYYSYPKPSASARLTKPSSSAQPIYNRNTDLYASASTVSPIYLSPLINKPKNHSFTITKQSFINTNHNNLTFTDILTKEKLDFTVNDIVKDTSNIFETNSVNKLGQLKERVHNRNSEIDLSPISMSNHSSSVRNLSRTVLQKNSLPSTKISSQSARLTKDPSSSLELPVESLRKIQSNQISTLPYFKPKDKPSAMDTEKTVTIKITLPERTAEFILRSNNESEFDHLEILATDNSNYLVLTNGRFSNKSRQKFIPLGKLVVDKNVNVSNPQAFIYDFLSNSINAANTYENNINENIKKFNFATTQTFGQQFQNINAEELNEISEKISQLTTAQYNNNQINNHFQKGNLVSTEQTSSTTGNTNRGTSKFVNGISQNHNNQVNKLQNGLYSPNDEVNGQYYSSNFYGGNKGASAKLQVNPNMEIEDAPFYQVDDGVRNSNQNEQSPNHSTFTDGVNEQNRELNEYQHNQNNPIGQGNPLNESEEIELLDTGLPQSASPAKLQVAPSTTNQPAAKGSIESVNNENGIGAQFHKQIVGTINHPVSDNNLITYKADRSFYVYTKYLGSGNNGLSEKLGNKRFGEISQIQNGVNANLDETSKNQENKVNTVQFIPSLGFKLEDQNSQQHIVNGEQYQRGSQYTFTSNEQNHQNGFGRLNQNEQTSSLDYSQHNAARDEAALQQYRNSHTNNLYAGPSSYSAPQASVGRLELPQQAPPNIAPSPPSYGPARLEDFEDTAGYPKVTPAIPFSF